MWQPLEDIEPFNRALIDLEQKLLAVYRGSYGLGEMLEAESLAQLWALIDRHPYQAVLMARIKSSHAMTPRHALNVMLMARAWAVTKHKLGRHLEHFSVAALCHDLGHWQDPSLVYVFDHFTHDQFRQLQKHPELPEDAVELIGEPAVTWIREHHEQPDGKGYPHGLKSDQLQMLSQALRTIDCYEGLTTARRFRPRYTPYEAFQLMGRWAGSRIHGGLLASFRNFLGRYPVGTFVVLGDRTRGIVIPPVEKTAVNVLQLTDPNGDALPEPSGLELPWDEIEGEAPSWHRPELPERFRYMRPDLLDLPRAY